jgi:hypothetical protein
VLNPLGIREELYALIHHIHHDLSDQDEDLPVHVPTRGF